MAKKLKVCLAMGGGVSLGTFSGAALTEALKVLVLYGRSSDGIKYDSIEIDGMSGASAGSIALAIMMRSLIDYKSMLPILLDTELAKSETFTENQIEDRVINTYNIKKDNPKFEIIKALEVAQIVQKFIWVNTLDTAKLFTYNKPKFGEPFGLLSRDEAINTAKKILLDGVEKINIENRQLITEQALMAFTMANLSPIVYGEKSIGDKKYTPPLVKTLQDSTNINNHNEIRVFDFHFVSPLITDTRYITIPSQNKDLSKKRALNDKDTWAEILASAIASGAFPIGFPPAIITKYKEEYSKNEWPKDENIKYLNFAYVDGGTFNNEPIKEAFKLGAYVDFLKEDPNIRDKEDRLILFVDPAIPGDTKVRQLKSLDPIKEIDDLEFKVKQTPTKMINVSIDLLSAVASQSEINEEGKVQEFYQNAILNNYLLDYFTNLKVLELENVLNPKFLESTYKSLSHSLNSRYISIGTRDVKKYIYWKYKLICSLKQHDACLGEEPFNEIFDLIDKHVTDKINKNIISEIEKIIKSEGCNPKTETVNIGSSLFLAIAELGLNQFGKDVDAERAGIFPIQGQSGDFKVENLPGHEIAAFSGFASKDAREACFAKGRLDALKCLSSNDFREYHYHTMLNQNSNPINAYIAEPLVDNILKIFENEFREHYNKWEISFEDDIEKNMRKKIVDRIYNIFTSITDQTKLSFSKKFGILWKLITNKNDLVKRLVNEELISQRTIHKLTHKTKTIAIKFRYRGNVKSTVFELEKNKSKAVRPYYYNDENHYIYFKCYLVMVPKLMDKANKVTEYCYLSLSEYVDNTVLRNLENINKVADSDKIIKLRSTNGAQFENFHLDSSDILKFIEDNYQFLKFNINPVIEIKATEMTIHDLSEPLANTINPSWKPFI